MDDSHRRQTWAFSLRPDGWLSNGRLFVDQDLEPLGTVPFPELPANLAFGSEDLRSIYMTARTSTYRIRVKAPGVKVL